MTAAQDAVAYIYENVGLEALVPSKEGVGYVYENVGVQTGQESKEGVGYIYEFVDAAAPMVPHLWKVFPATGIAGDLIEIWGHGWTGTTLKFYLSVQADWDGSEEIDAPFVMTQSIAAAMVAATANAYNAARSIPADDFEPNVEHWKATITVPASASGLRPIRLQVTT